MYRLIYFTADNSYSTFDSEKDAEMNEKEKDLIRTGLEVVCLIDYKRHSISKKCPRYAQHRDFIDDMIFDPKFVTNY